MKISLQVAYMPDSRMSLSLTPEDIGALIHKCPSSDLERIFSTLQFQTKTFGNDDRREEMSKYLKEEILDKDSKDSL